MKKFNIRVYGLLLNSEGQVLVSDENRFGLQFTKFPGGGLEWGEGTIDALKREFREELAVDVEVGDLFYVTDFFQASAFDEEDQIISIYYRISFPDWRDLMVRATPFDFNGEQEVQRWVSLDDLAPEDFRFPIDKVVVQRLKAYNFN